MRYLIMSTYDSGYWWEIKTNDCSLDREEYDDNVRITGLEILCNRLENDLLDMVEDEIPFEEFDFVVLCVDGSVRILKDCVEDTMDLSDENYDGRYDVEGGDII